MKRFFLVMILFFSCMLVALARGGVDSVLVRLDRVMGQQEIYMEQKEERIDSLETAFAFIRHLRCGNNLSSIRH